LLGLTAIVGRRMWECQQRFRIVAGPLLLAAYRRFLPGRESLKRLSAWVRLYIGDEFEWDVQLVLKADEVPRISLGREGDLGWTTWLTSRAPKNDVGDLVLSPAAVGPFRAAG